MKVEWVVGDDPTSNGALDESARYYVRGLTCMTVAMSKWSFVDPMLNRPARCAVIYPLHVLRNKVCTGLI